MPFCWDTVCAYCGDTSCYWHSIEIGGKWYCRSCAPFYTAESPTKKKIRLRKVLGIICVLNALFHLVLFCWEKLL